MEFKLKMKESKELIDQRLKTLFNSPDNKYHKSLYDSMKYSLECGGKRLRPILCIESAKLFGDVDEVVMNTALGLEMIHTYSLIHDDLPSMDNDDLRRGKPTNHKVYGEDMAILSGDGLLNSSYELLMKTALVSDRPLQVIEAASHISMRAGVDGMIVGQVADILTDREDDINLETLDYINLNKTGALIEASLVAGALVNGASDNDVEILSQVGFNLGICFQLIDDLLDIEGDESKLGKPIGSDAKNNKKTYPSLIEIEEVKKLAYKLTESSKALLLSLGKDTTFLSDLFDYLLVRES